MVSVIIPTYNRVELLKSSVESILNQDYVEWELIIVDNNSSDSTAEYVQAVCRKDSRVRYILEPRQGLSYTKNTGVKNASFDIIAFLDDDEKASPGWVSVLLDTFKKHPDAGCVGGKTVLENKERIPRWISPRLYSCLGEWNGPKGKVMTVEVDRIGFMGGNMAVRKSAFVEVGGFNEELGRKADNLRADEDNELCYYIFDAGYKLFFVPEAIVFHALLPGRLCVRYFKNNARGLANTRARRERVLSYTVELFYRLFKLPVDLLLFKDISYIFFRIGVVGYKIQGALKLSR